MASKTKTTTGEDSQAQGGAARKFTLGKLRENCRRLFGVSTSTFDGATYGMTGTYTVKEMRAHIKEWSEKGVK